MNITKLLEKKECHRRNGKDHCHLQWRLLIWQLFLLILILRPAKKNYFLKIKINILASVPAFCAESIRAAATTTSQTIMSRKKCVVLFGRIYEYSFQEEEGSLSSFLKLNPRDLNSWEFQCLGLQKQRWSMFVLFAKHLHKLWVFICNFPHKSSICRLSMQKQILLHWWQSCFVLQQFSLRFTFYVKQQQHLLYNSNKTWKKEEWVKVCVFLCREMNI